MEVKTSSGDEEGFAVIVAAAASIAGTVAGSAMMSLLLPLSVPFVVEAGECGEGARPAELTVFWPMISMSPAPSLSASKLTLLSTSLLTCVDDKLSLGHFSGRNAGEEASGNFLFAVNFVLFAKFESSSVDKVAGGC